MAQPKLLLFFLCPILASCAASSHARVEGPDLARSVLLIRELPDGQVVHHWRRAEDFDLSQYRHLSGATAAERTIVLAANRKRDCDEENDECFRKCMDRPLARGFGHTTSGGRKRGGKEEFCIKECQQAYADCRELEKLKPQEFMAVDGALDWLKRNHKLVLVGSVVVIAGVAFVVISGGAGLVILAPAVLLAAPAFDHPGYAAGATP
ncbi:MAG TPA: hypothetical protein VK539_11595 [Myxococcaceae bacterium]|nr:hypothetical protein [Myxococcaceae bacterium]